VRKVPSRRGELQSALNVARQGSTGWTRSQQFRREPARAATTSLEKLNTIVAESVAFLRRESRSQHMVEQELRSESAC